MFYYLFLLYKFIQFFIYLFIDLFIYYANSCHKMRAVCYQLDHYGYRLDNARL